MSDDPFNLARFRAAQDPVFETALTELRAGRKRTHWIWFVFPQLRGLGRSPTAQHYGVASIVEAHAYLADPVLAERLRLVVEAVLNVQGRSAHDIFGSPDDLKFRSSITLFSEVADDPGSAFRQALDRYFDGQPDEATLALLRVGAAG